MEGLNGVAGWLDRDKDKDKDRWRAASEEEMIKNKQDVPENIVIDHEQFERSRRKRKAAERYGQRSSGGLD